MGKSRGKSQEKIMGSGARRKISILERERTKKEYYREKVKDEERERRERE